ncbi:MAG: GNAT family N-acetyltransferase [Nitrospirae bacterium]|nr:GNAT family N-acetyltransferase [Nitrospirota bacterium]
MEYLFYRKESKDITRAGTTLEKGYTFRFWHPSVSSIVPSGMPLMPFAVWWMMHYLRVFRNRDYGLFLVYYGQELVHRSGIFPGYFRFPFMSPDDLQIGDTWTHPGHVRRGIASFAIQQILSSKERPGRSFWYVVRRGNLSSIRVIEKAGFVKAGEGMRIKRFGLRLLGSFRITETGQGMP